jgi:hypothetical protein
VYGIYMCMGGSIRYSYDVLRVGVGTTLQEKVSSVSHTIGTGLHQGRAAFLQQDRRL